MAKKDFVIIYAITENSTIFINTYCCMRQIFKFVALILLPYSFLNSLTFADVSKIEELLNIIQKT